MTTDTLSPQPDPHGVLWMYQVSRDGKGKRMSLPYSLQNLSSDGFTWCHLQCDAEGAIAWMREQGLDMDVIESLTVIETRPRALTIAEGELIVLRGVNTNPRADPEDMVSLRLWVTGNLVISARKKERRLMSFEDLRQKIEAGKGPGTTGEFVVGLVERLADRIGTLVDEIDEDLTEFETNLGSGSIATSRRNISVARRQTAAIRRYLAPQREALDTLFRARGKILSDDDAFAIREQTDRITRYVEDLDLARERALVLQEELQNRIAEEQNARVYVLSLVAAIFLPLSYLTGVFGMNVAGLPGTENPTSFYYLAGFMGVIAILLVVVMRWRRWL